MIRQRDKCIEKRLNRSYRCPYCDRENAGFERRYEEGPVWCISCKCGLRTPYFYTPEEAVYQWQLFQKAFPADRPKHDHWLLANCKNDLNALREGMEGDYSLTYMQLRHRLTDYFVAIGATMDLTCKFAPIFSQYVPAGDGNPFHVVKKDGKTYFSREDANYVVDEVLKLLDETSGGEDLNILKLLEELEDVGRFGKFEGGV